MGFIGELDILKKIIQIWPCFKFLKWISSQKWTKKRYKIEQYYTLKINPKRMSRNNNILGLHKKFSCSASNIVNKKISRENSHESRLGIKSPENLFYFVILNLLISWDFKNIFLVEILITIYCKPHVIFWTMGTALVVDPQRICNRAATRLRTMPEKLKVMISKLTLQDDFIVSWLKCRKLKPNRKT